MKKYYPCDPAKNTANAEYAKESMSEKIQQDAYDFEHGKTTTNLLREKYGLPKINDPAADREYVRMDGQGGHSHNLNCDYEIDWFSRITSIIAILISLIAIIARALQ